MAEHTATLKLKLKSTSGYSETAEYKNVSSETWGRVVGLLNGRDDVTNELVQALRFARGLLARNVRISPQGLEGIDLVLKSAGVTDE